MYDKNGNYVVKTLEQVRVDRFTWRESACDADGGECSCYR